MSGQLASSPEPFRPCILYSYAYVGHNLVPFLNRLGQYVHILIDSGGFTDYWQDIREKAGYERQGPPISLPAYIEFCRALRVWGYVALDRIRDEPGTLANLERMVAAGLQPIPVFVEGARWESLRDLVAVNRRVCLAGAVRTGDAYVLQRYQLAMRHTDGQILTHALGYGRWPEILHVPIASSDSSTWTMGAQYGVVLFFDPLQGMTSYRQATMERHNRTTLLAKMARLQIPPEEIANRARWWQGGRHQPSIPLFTTATAYLDFARYLWEKANVAYFVVMNASSIDLHYWAAMASQRSWPRYVRVLRRLGSLYGEELLAAQVEIARAFHAGRPWGRA